ncbi:MAG: mechanosensitive ion channel [Candidatus Latescibacterota bacterium]|nr:MAG: mechanosensitive ion channel [Candidatus Latescibacterota bacterium]
MSELLSEFADWSQRFLGVSPTVVERIAWSILAWLIYLALRVVVSAVVDRRVSDVGKKYLLAKSFNYILGFAVIIVTMIIWFGNVTGWAAYLGILSAGLAIALQDPVTNLAGWIFITVRKPFGVGDRIQIGEHRGDVIDMRLFQFTLVEIGNWVDADQSTGRIIHIPNGWVFKHSTANYTAGFNFIWNELPITITFESNWEKAKQILTDIAARHSILEDREAQEQVRRAARKYLIYFQHLTPIVWTSVADNGVTLTVRYICEPRKRRSSEGAIWEEVLRGFGSADDIDFAYPTTRFYNNISEGKPEARAAPEE